MLDLYVAPLHSNANEIWSAACHGAIGAVLSIDYSLKSSWEDFQALIDMFKHSVGHMAIGMTHIDQNT